MPVGGDWEGWVARCAQQPMLAGCSKQQLEQRRAAEKRQVNMNIVVNVRSPTDTDAEAAPQRLPLRGEDGVAMPRPP